MIRVVEIVRPYRFREQIDSLRDQLPQELLKKVEWLVSSVMDMTQCDIDQGASGQIMVDKNFKPTGAPPPDPDGAYCMICYQRIWEHDNNTAFPTELVFHGNQIKAGGGACCPECSKLSDADIKAQLPETRPPLKKI
jgi:hypothetical protein